MHIIYLDLVCFILSNEIEHQVGGSKDLNCGGNNLTSINSGNIGSEIKFIDTLKCYQKSLGELVSILTEEEKQSVRTLTSQFSNQHYFTET